ncbi:conserved hypothetical protein [Talaromyces stipitatus ATCC 10500]|uniref:Uncharacterized protein n=1 Tax=Talaromyces stipitatus (strain ATCC 10500 / CBS 375.48 / QM 6759 / NRRL 1006) TaxID=441959 RepID=B8MHF0_TALSN|nr:uncharacterized protein TSTA_021860 [Talaromyces stipitatus ATCC 10500]EED17129.1 conserved hypothetical protein [Talaromyces stipitatus ATCC 10500]
MSSRLDISSTDHTASESLLASILVARFLRSNNYHETLNTFINEAGLPPNVGAFRRAQNTGDDKLDGANIVNKWTLEGIIQEKKKFDQTLSFERLGDSHANNEGWTMPAPAVLKAIETPASSNLLSASVEPWQMDDGVQDKDQKATYLVATGADKRLNLFNLDADNTVAASISGLTDSPILSYASIRGGQYHLLATMSGQLLLVRGNEIIDRRKDHTKYVVKVVAYEDHDNHIWIVTAGWDMQVFIYSIKPNSSSGTELEIGNPVGSLKVPTNPESILLVHHPETRDLTLLLSRRDSTYIYYYNIEPLRTRDSQQRSCKEIGKQNLAPNSNAWVSFSPSCMTQNPRDPGIIAVALSTLPHMKVMIVRLLFPTKRNTGDDERVNNEATPATHLSQSNASLALQNHEDAAIIIQANTFAPQTAYSTPQVVWRPDGSGVWVNGDDGVIRGIESKTGKLVTMLKNGHEAGIKVRSIWAGWVEGEEWLVSGGFDKKLIVWKPERSETRLSSNRGI